MWLVNILMFFQLLGHNTKVFTLIGKDNLIDPAVGKLNFYSDTGSKNR